MPSTPPPPADDASTAWPTPPAELSTHNVCPPEEDRAQHAQHQHATSLLQHPQARTSVVALDIRGDSDSPSASSSPAATREECDEDDEEERQESVRRMNEREEDAGAGAESSKRVEAEEDDEMLLRGGSSSGNDTPSPRHTEDAPKGDNDARLAEASVSPAASTPAAGSAAAVTRSPSPYYSQYPQKTGRLLPSTTSSFLRPGSKFSGTQQSDRMVYNVQVEIKQVDMDESFLCGYLQIQGLTDDNPTLTTYFEGEIIGNKHTFKTAHPEWGSSEKVDMQHWARFPAWRPLAKAARSPSFSFGDYAQRENLFMRWKESFLVPDHKVKTINGASFEGFYYICFNQCSGTVSGIYFHARSEKYQQLELEHVQDRGCMGAMEFR